MSVRVNLEIAGQLDLEALENNFEARTHRLTVQLQIKLKDGWSDYRRAIIDTGSPYSVIPKSWFPNLDARGLFKAEAFGLVPDIPLNGIMVEAECLATDGPNSSNPFKIAGLLTEKNLPLVLGLHGLLDQVQVYFCIPRKEAWIQFD